MFKTLFLLSAAVAVALSSAVPQVAPEEAPVSYSGFKVFKVTLEKDEVEAFNTLRLTSDLVADTWKEPTATASPLRSTNVKYWSDVLVAPAQIPAFLAATSAYNVSTKIEDVGAVISAQAEEIQRVRSASPKLGWEAYYDFEEIDEFVVDLVAAHGDIASQSVIGRSTLGRPIRMVKISKNGSPKDKNAILIDGGFHAREWISPAIVTYILDQMLNNRAENQAVLDAVDLYIIPIINPDGYAHTKTDRMWRKTRSKPASSSCYGTDPNRNFDFHFGGSGTSANPCSEIYHGYEAFSEPETLALRNVILYSGHNFQSYLTIHSYGQWWLTPWSWTYTLPEDYDDLMRFGNVGAKALAAVYGTEYEVGATTEILGATAGCSDDWAKAEGGIKYANTIEVRDTGRYGFLLPPAQIRETAIETWAGIKAACLFDFSSSS